VLDTPQIIETAPQPIASIRLCVPLGEMRKRAMSADPLYVDTAIERWERMTGKQAWHATGQTFADIIPIQGGNFSG
jgi:hypothetical protein